RRPPRLAGAPPDDGPPGPRGVEPIDLARLREPAPAPLPDEADADTAETDDRVDLAGAFEVLEEDERPAVSLVYVRALDRGAAATRLGISERQLARRTDAALAKLRGEMERSGAPPSSSPPKPVESPKPQKSTSKKPNGHSGRLLLRMPPPLHADLAKAAERSDTSLNQFIVNRLSAPADEPAGDEPRWLRTALIVNAVLLAVAA